MLDDTAWIALALSLTLCGAVWTWYAFSRRGVVSGLRGLGLTLLPVAALLTGALRMLVEVAEAVLRWAAGLVLSPVVWLGVGVAVVAVALFVVAGVLSNRAVQRDRTRRSGSPRGVQAGAAAGAEPAAGDASGSSAGAEGAEGMDEVEEILRRRGIS